MRIITTLLPVAFLLAILPQAGAAAVTEIKADDRGHFVTKAEIEGSDITVLVDTGASAVALSFEDADEIGLRPASLTYDTPIMTANGVIKAARAFRPRPSPSHRPVAIASTFLTAPPTSTPVMSSFA